MIMNHQIVVYTWLLACVAVGLITAKRNNQAKVKIRYGGRIVNGARASIASFPYMVSIQRKQNTWTHFCGGSIFNPTIILTACHCVVHGQRINGDHWKLSDTSSMRVVAGASDWAKPTQGQQTARVSQLMAHPKCSNHARVNGVYNYDVGVVFLETPLFFTNSVQPFKLFSGDVLTALVELKKMVMNKMRCTTPGWGFTSEQTRSTSTELMTTTVQLMTTKECRERFCLLSNSHCRTDFYSIHQMCVVSSDSSDCYGDSGGPLICNGFLVGTVSYGHHCYPGWPTVFQHTLPIIEILNMATGKLSANKSTAFAAPKKINRKLIRLYANSRAVTGRNNRSLIGFLRSFI